MITVLRQVEDTIEYIKLLLRIKFQNLACSVSFYLSICTLNNVAQKFGCEL